MKIQVTMKDPDTMHEAVEDAVKAEVAALGLPRDEAEDLVEIRVEKELSKMGKWFEYGEYLRVECDTEAMTATVLEVIR